MVRLCLGLGLRKWPNEQRFGQPHTLTKSPVTSQVLFSNFTENLRFEEIQEAQLMMTTGSTRLAVSRGQQTWYHSTCYIVSYCAIVTLSLRRAVFTIFVFKKFHDLEMGVKVTQGH